MTKRSSRHERSFGIIDFLPVPPTLEGEMWDRHERELLALAGHDSTVETVAERMLQQMDAAGIERAFIPQARTGSYGGRRAAVDTALEDVLEFTSAHPDRFVGLAGYNPFLISESLHELQVAVVQHGFRGAFAQIEGYDLPLHDRRMYPLYAKCAELGVPVVLRAGIVADAAPSDCARPIYLDRIASDFPELTIIAAQTGWAWSQELVCVCAKWPNIVLGLDGSALDCVRSEALEFLVGQGRKRCLWGSNGMPWTESLRLLAALGLPEDITRAILRDNALAVFALPGARKAKAAAAADVMVAER